MKNIISICYSAIQNERSVQSYLYSMKSLDSDLYGSAPGLVNVLDSDLRFRSPLVIFIKLLFPLLLVLINLYFLGFYIFKKIFLKSKVSTGLVAYNNVLFASSYSAIFLSKKVIADKCLVILRPGRITKNDLDGDDQFSILDSLLFISYFKLLGIFFKVLIVSFFLLFRRDSSTFFLLLPYLFELLVVKESCETLSASVKPKCFYITDHFDRWAVLFDQLKALRVFHNFSIIQHGVLVINDVDDFKISLSYRLSNVDFLYYFDDVSLDVFKAKVFSVDCMPFVRKFSNGISLVDFDVKGFSILFVGSPICYKFQSELMIKLNDGFSRLSLFYKPHPTDITSYQSLQNNINYLTVVSGSVFPKVNVVVSYPSSLAYQYSELGIPVIFHDLNSGFDEINMCLNEIKSHYENSL